MLLRRKIWFVGIFQGLVWVLTFKLNLEGDHKQNLKQGPRFCQRMQMSMLVLMRMLLLVLLLILMLLLLLLILM